LENVFHWLDDCVTFFYGDVLFCAKPSFRNIKFKIVGWVRIFRIIDLRRRHLCKFNVNVLFIMVYGFFLVYNTIWVTHTTFHKKTIFSKWLQRQPQMIICVLLKIVRYGTIMPFVILRFRVPDVEFVFPYNYRNYL
jgi:hypothetical protein